MTEELQKTLIESGFKHKHDETCTGYDCITLSELIEACGYKLSTMRQGRYYGEDGWVVGQDSDTGTNPLDWRLHTFGKTPEEAVARLWLTLNKK